MANSPTTYAPGQHPYTVQQGKPRHSFLCEHGILVASVYRRASVNPETLSFYDVRWYSQAAFRRFEDFSDSLTIGETLEALGA